jgi:hypothetical protein
MKSRLSFARLMMLANGIYWMVFAVLFVTGSYPYRPHRPVFEEVAPNYIFFGKALRQIDTGTGVGLPPRLITLTYAIQRPTVLATRPFYWYFDSHDITVDQLYWGVSVGGYYLLLVCVLSFVQWYLIGWVVQKLWHRWFSHPTAAPSHAPSTPTTL